MGKKRTVKSDTAKVAFRSIVRIQKAYEDIKRRKGVFGYCE
jgi:hypothetical protein